MSVSRAHLKLCVKDLYAADEVQANEAYMTAIITDEDQRPAVFKNVRISGIVIESAQDHFYIDDGTGIIQVTIPEGCQFPAPSLSCYIEVLGKLNGTNQRTISLFCYNDRSDPMEEVRHMLEIAAFHRNYFRYRQSLDDNYLSSDAPVNNAFDMLTKRVLQMITDADPSEGVSMTEIQEICDSDESVAQRVVQNLQNNCYIYESNNSYFLL